jgi:putative MATE family efflux protein
MTARTFPGGSAPALSPATPLMTARTRRMLEGSILSTLLRLAIPSIIVVVVQAASGTFDALFVSRLGPDALAGVALVFPVWMLMVTMSAGGFGGGIASAIARALGAGHRADANALATHAIVIALVLAVLFTVGPLWGGPWLYSTMGGVGASLDTALTYSNLVFAGAVLIWLVNALGSINRGAGDMIFPAVVIVGGEVLHIVLAPILIFGLGPLPAMGIAGAATSLLISYTIRTVILAAHLLRRGSASPVRLAAPRLGRRMLWDILRVALPSSVNTILTNGNVMVVTGFVGSFGTFALAGYGIGSRLEYLQIPLVFGFGTALVTMVGTNVGAGRLDRARRITWIGAGLAAAVTGVIGVVVAIVPGLWFNLFSDRPDVLAAGWTYARIVGPTYGFFGLGLALYFAAQGAGQVVWALIAAVTRVTIVIAGAWAAVFWFGGGLPSVFASVAIGFVMLGAIQVYAINRAIPRQRVEQPVDEPMARVA